MNVDILFSINDWESNFFDRKIFHIDERGVKLDSISLDGATVCAKINSENIKAIDFLNSNGFTFQKGEIDFKGSISSINEHNLIEATLDDVNFILKYVSDFYSDSRFVEPYFTSSEKLKFYQSWIKNAFLKSYDTTLLVSKASNGDIAGFVSGRHMDSSHIRIGLLGVFPKYQRNGIARKLMEGIASNMNSTSVSVSTQIENTRAINFYQKLGLKINSTSYWFYK